MVLGQVSAIAAQIASNQGLEYIQDVDYRQINSIMKLDPYLDGSTPDILVDDASEAVSCTGGWTRRKGKGSYGPSYLEIDRSTADEYVEYRAEVADGGEYDIYSYQHAAKNLAEITDFEIVVNGDTTRSRFSSDDLHVVGQARGEWHHLGTHHFNADSEVIVRIYGENSDRPLRADAILIIRK